MAAAAPRPAPGTRRYPWPTVVVALAVLAQIAGMAALLYLQILSQERIVLSRLTVTALVEALFGLALFGLATLTVIVSGCIAIVTTLRRGRNAWSNSMFVQMLVLVIGLVLYTRDPRPWYAYTVMLGGVLVVAYLMLPGVQATFLPPPEAAHD